MYMGLHSHFVVGHAEEDDFGRADDDDMGVLEELATGGMHLPLS